MGKFSKDDKGFGGGNKVVLKMVTSGFELGYHSWQCSEDYWGSED